MSKRPISISIETDLLDRVDRLAELRGDTRTAVIERAIRNDIAEQEEFIESLANPVVRGVHKTLTSSPTLLRIIARLVDEDMSDGDIRALMERAPRDRKAGERIKADKRANRGKSARGSGSTSSSTGDLLHDS